MISDATKSRFKVCIKAVQKVKKKGKAFCLFRQAKASRIGGGGGGVENNFMETCTRACCTKPVLSI